MDGPGAGRSRHARAGHRAGCRSRNARLADDTTRWAAVDHLIPRGRSQAEIRVRLRTRRLRAQVRDRERQRDPRRRLAGADHIEGRCGERLFEYRHRRRAERIDLPLHDDLCVSGSGRRRRLSGSPGDDRHRHRPAERFQCAVQRSTDSLPQHGRQVRLRRSAGRHLGPGRGDV